MTIALALLREASVDGRLTIEELAERAELVQRRPHARRGRRRDGRSRGIRAAAGPRRSSGTARCSRAVTREGRWRIARAQSRYSAVFGSVQLDLREAVLPGPEIEIEAKAVFGSSR